MTTPASVNIEDVLNQLVRRESGDDTLVTSWVIVCETVESGGDIGLLTFADHTHPYWHHRGMLEHAAIPSEADDDD